MSRNLRSSQLRRDEVINEDNVSENDTDNSDDSSTSDLEVSGANDLVKNCEKLKLPAHIVAYIKNQELIRDDTEAISCDPGLVEKVMTNYIIVKKILNNLSWQDKLLCKHVCTTWHSAVNALIKEQITAVDFVMNVQKKAKLIIAKLEKSSNFSNEPMAVLTFTNSQGFNMTSPCTTIALCSCSPPCEKEHCLLDVLQNEAIAPKNCMLTVIASHLIYKPLPQSITADHTITLRNIMCPRLVPSFIGGVYIPVIPNVEFHVLNIKHVNRDRSTIDMERDFFDVIDKLSQTRIFKGLIVYVNERFILHSVEDIVFLDYIKKVQPDIPYALGGCIVEETMFEENDMDTVIDRIKNGSCFVSENFITVGAFSIPKNVNNTEDQSEKYNFDMYSLVIESSEWTKDKIQQSIDKFARSVPQFEHSVAIKLSCVGRDRKHDVEQDYFRAAFPHTLLVGCYGNGELGINHPAPPPECHPRTVKRHKYDNGPTGIMYSYSTVFLYIGWGKIIASPAMDKRT